MLQTFRAITDSVAGKALFAILVGTFALLGVGYGMRDLVLGHSSANDAATVAGTKISLAELDRTYRRALQNASQRFGPSFVPGPAEKAELARRSLDEQVTETLFVKAAADSGLRISDVVVRERTEAMPTFAGADGKFDRARLQLILENQGMSEAAFADRMRRDIARELLIGPVIAGAVTPKALTTDLYRYRNESRVAETMFLPDTAATGIPAPTDAQLQAYYQSHQPDFTLREYRRFTVLPLSADLFMGEVTPTEEELRIAYEQRKADFVLAEKRRIDQVVVTDKAVADAIAKAAQASSNLADAAKAATGGKAQVVSLETLAREDYPEALRDPVFSGSLNQVAGPIHSPLGWHVIKITGIEPGHEVSFEQARPKLVADVKHDKASDILSDQLDSLGDRLLGGMSMEQLAASVNAAPVKFGPIDAKGGRAPNATDPKQGTSDPAWLAKAFQLQGGETSGFEAAKSGGYFAVRLDQIIPPTLQPFADVRANVVAGWIADQRAAVTAKQADAVAAQARAGTPMAQLAAKAGLKLDTSTPLKRQPETGSDSDTALAASLFHLDKVGDVATVPTQGGQIVARLAEIRAADPVSAGDAMKGLTAEINGQLRDEQAKDYETELRSRYKVTINPQAIERIAGS